MVRAHLAVLLVSHTGLWDGTWKSSALICCAKEDVRLQFFHDSEKQRDLKGHMVVCDLFYGFIQYCLCAFSPTTVSQLDWIDSARVDDLHNSRTSSVIQNSFANAHQRHEIRHVVRIFFKGECCCTFTSKIKLKWNLGISVFLQILPKCFTTLNFH